MQQVRQEVLDRFLRYVRVDTRSDFDSTTTPSTQTQWNLARLLETELKELELEEIELTDKCYLYATLPSNLGPEKAAPTIGLIAHLDTSPEVTGTNVNPQLHEDYNGGDLILPGDPTVVIRANENPRLKDFLGDTIVTSDGSTLLGADDKSGIAIILTLVSYLRRHPEIPHGKVRLGFTPDEEIGRGADHFDVDRFGADYAYTVDGSNVGEVENETFCADSCDVTLHGANWHPGMAKGHLINALKAAGEVLARLPEDGAPETTEGREGFIHPMKVTGDVEQALIRFIVRDFEVEGLEAREEALRRLVADACAAHPGITSEIQITESYRNMRFRLDDAKECVDVALEGIRRAGITPKLEIVRGGTDGARLCYMGLPTPNFFAGGQNFHSKREWVAVSAMVGAVKALAEVLQVWLERGEAA